MYGKETSLLSLIPPRLGRRIGWFMLCILVANFLSTAALSAKSADLQYARETGSGAQSYIICTPQGLKRITLDDEGNPVGNDKAGLKYCVYCIPFHKVNITTFSVDVVPPDIEFTLFKFYFTNNHLIIPRDILDKSRTPRAPPVA
ncbi:MAG: DUF2946 domain-containing protein [Alphaproteobacteria bacterium]|nr:DUF2946 domain-containing protein [Alphaproteobacteria bacterium]